MGSSIDLAALGEKLPHEHANFHRVNVADLLSRKSTGFPGAQPVSFARQHLFELARDDYFLCEKTDGIRCLLYCTQMFNGDGQPPQELYFLIDRKNDYYAIAPGFLHLPKLGDDISAFQPGTILDGELVRDKFPNGVEQITYLIFDSLAIDGQSIMDRPFDIRIGKVKKGIFDPWRQFKKDWPGETEVQPFQIDLKRMERPYGMEMMFRERIPQLTHGNDGLIFTCCTTPYVSGTDKHILKWKPPHENTIDFRVHIGEFPVLEDDQGAYEDWDALPALNLYVNHGSDRYQLFAALAITPTEWTAIKSLNQMIDGRIIECFRDAATGAWRPKLEDDGTPRFRDDKTDANHISTVNSVLESIEDAVSETDLIAHAGQIRTAFKEREVRKRVRAAEEQKRRVLAAQAQQQPRRSQPPPAQQPANVESVDDGPIYDD